jgi:ornithine cyclodeaminase
VVVYGTGPQGRGHLATLEAVAGVSTVDMVGRARAGSPEVALALGQADVVVCATTAREPLFDSALLRDSAIVLAVGSHEPDAREVDAAFCRRATVIVEDVATALRECGDVVLAIAEGALGEERLVPIRDAVSGPPLDGPLLFKGSGMAWQDLVVAEAVLAAAVR